jgi:hypothetical protein
VPANGKRPARETILIGEADSVKDALKIDPREYGRKGNVVLNIHDIKYRRDIGSTLGLFANRNV